jgi:hypothetical protein
MAAAGSPTRLHRAGTCHIPTVEYERDEDRDEKRAYDDLENRRDIAAAQPGLKIDSQRRPEDEWGKPVMGQSPFSEARH